MTVSNSSGPAEVPAGPDSRSPFQTTNTPGGEPAAQSRVRAGWALALLATVAFSVAPPIARVAIDSGLNPTQILFVRLWSTALLLAITIAVMDWRLLVPDRRCRTIGIVTGLINGFGMMGYFWALTRLDVSIASMLFSVSPLLTLTVLALRGEPVTRRHIVRLALALAGVYFLIGPGGRVDLIGVLLIGVSAVSFTGQIVAMQYYLGPYDARSVTLYVTLGMAIGISTFWLIQGAPFIQPTAGGWVAILILALVSTYLSRLAMFAAIGRIGGAQMALLAPLEIMLTVIWAVAFLAERLSLVQWLGGSLVLASALLSIERLGRVRVPVRWRLWPHR